MKPEQPVGVTDFLDRLDHPFRKEIEHLRNYILSANTDLTENIKWNGPNYQLGGEDRITMSIQPPKKQVQLIFHRGAKKLIPPENKLIEDKSGLLSWKGNDRAIITFKHLHDIEKSKDALTLIVNEWILATK